MPDTGENPRTGDETAWPGVPDVYLILWQGGVDLGGPSENAAAKIFNVCIAVLFEEHGGLLAAGTGFAVGDDFGVFRHRNVAEALFERAERDLGDAEVDDLVFVGVADVEDEGFVAGVHAGF